jgi:hypothetical protein
VVTTEIDKCSMEGQGMAVTPNLKAARVVW